MLFAMLFTMINHHRPHHDSADDSTGKSAATAQRGQEDAHLKKYKSQISDLVEKSMENGAAFRF